MHILVPVPVHPHAPASVFGQVFPRVQVRKSACRSMSLAWRSTALFACALPAAGSVLAGPPPESLLPVRLDRVEVRLDGRIEEPVWADATLLDDLYQMSPIEGAPPAHPTRIWMVYDNEALYVAFRVSEPDPSQISSRSLERDSYYPPNHKSLETDQDAVALLLDTFNDDRSAFVFVVTPDGVRSDVQIFNDGESISDVPWNRDWDTFWDAASTRTADGWSVEMRIPFSSLRFASGPQGATMGLILWRYRARNVEFDIYPSIPNRWRFSPYKPSQAMDVVFEGIRPRTPVYIRPYVLGGPEQQSVLTAAGTGYERETRLEREVGLDVKVNVTSDLILDATVNTDFAQIEADDQQINLTRFSLFFPEKRQFFQERSDLFYYRLPGGEERLFHSRQIGLANGSPIPILGGARLTGRAAGWDVGIIDMQTAATRVDDTPLPTTNYGVLRLRRPVLDGGSYAGALVTSRIADDGAYNVALAGDADLRLAGQLYVGLQAAQTLETDVSAATSRYAAVNLQQRIQRGFAFGSAVGFRGSTFNPALGYFYRTGTLFWGARVQYTWFPSSGPIQNHTIKQRTQWYARTSDRVLETRMFVTQWTALLQSGATADVQERVELEDLVTGFSVGNVDVGPGRYTTATSEVRLESPRGRSFRTALELRGGPYYGGWQAGGAWLPQWAPSPHLQVGVDYLYSHIDVPVGIENLHVARVRIRGALDRTLTASAFVQYGRDDFRLSTNFRIRYNPREGTDLYLVYNEGMNTELDRETPTLPRFYGRTVVAKFSRTFIR